MTKSKCCGADMREIEGNPHEDACMKCGKRYCSSCGKPCEVEVYEPYKAEIGFQITPTAAPKPPSERQREDKKPSENTWKLLERYSIWLEKHGYLDSDWYTELPHTVDAFLDEQAQ